MVLWAVEEVLLHAAAAVVARFAIRVSLVENIASANSRAWTPRYWRGVVRRVGEL